MAGTNDFLPFATAGGANVLTQAAYAALAAVATGYQSGVAQSPQLNKTWRQSSIIASMVAQFIVDQTGANAVDDGTIATLESNFIAALRLAGVTIGVDTGAANACVVNLTPAVTALSDNLVLWFKAKAANTGAVTLNVNGLGASQLVGAGNVALQGGEIVANGKCLVVWDATLTKWVLIECTGGALQVAAATQSQQAIQAAQLQSSALINGVDTGVANACVVTYAPALTALTDGMVLWFKAAAANTGATTLNVNGLGAKAVVGGGHAALQGGEIIANGKCQLVWNATLNSFVLIECTGAALQATAATKSNQVPTLGQSNANVASGSSGWFKLPFIDQTGTKRDLIIQYGTLGVPCQATGTVGYYGASGVSLPVAFPNGYLAIIVSSQDQTGAAPYLTTWQSPTNSSFTMMPHASGSVANVNCSYIVIGY